MTDKQNHFTYTDNTSDNNDKIMENLHKQIIIDGVDVSGCIYYKATGKYNTCGYYCEQNPNCSYKNWKRKEQECEELNKYIKHLHNLCGNETDKQYKYKQALTEIKEIADLSIAHFDIDYLKQAINEILQKCEVLDETSKT